MQIVAFQLDIVFYSQYYIDSQSSFFVIDFLKKYDKHKNMDNA
jgi:hypothetical protein